MTDHYGEFTIFVREQSRDIPVIAVSFSSRRRGRPPV
jgi:hypothetical protein